MHILLGYPLIALHIMLHPSLLEQHILLYTCSEIHGEKHVLQSCDAYLVHRRVPERTCNNN